MKLKRGKTWEKNKSTQI